MSRKRFSDMRCGVAQALEQVGDWWTLLIVREAFLGSVRFADFEAWKAYQAEVIARTNGVLATLTEDILSEVVMEQLPPNMQNIYCAIVIGPGGQAVHRVGGQTHDATRPELGDGRFHRSPRVDTGVDDKRPVRAIHHRATRARSRPTRSARIVVW